MKLQAILKSKRRISPVTRQPQVYLKTSSSEQADDTLTGTDGDDLIFSRGGNDTIDGGWGNDMLNIFGSGEFAIDFDKISKRRDGQCLMENNSSSDTMNLNLTNVLGADGQTNEIVIHGDANDVCCI